jgi:hypothetical protein
MASGQFERLVRVFSALLPAVTGGCTERGIDEEAFDLRLCEGGQLDIVAGIVPAQPAEYTELRDIGETFDGSPPAMPYVLDAAGELCGGAMDVDACVAMFGALPVESAMRWSGGFDGGTTYRSIALTRGDTASALTTPDAVVEFLGPIDTVEDAGLLAVAQVHGLICDGRDNAAEVEDGFILFTRSGGGCGAGDDISEHVVHVSTEGALDVVQTEVVERGDPNCAVGRLPAGLCRRAPVMRGGAVGRFFAEVAELEAAAVVAFGQLATELEVHGAPRRLVRRALRSRRDEIRHAAATAALARRYGGRPVAPRVQPLRPRSLAGVAADNAVEGCVRETFGALVATLQARRAADPAVRRALRAIAVDETRHAALSWDLAAWAGARMSVAERRRAAADARRAGERLEHELLVEHPEAVHRLAGMPHPDEARALFRALGRALA